MKLVILCVCVNAITLTMELNQKFPKSMPQEKLAMGHLYEWEVPMQELGGKEGGRKFS